MQCFIYKSLKKAELYIYLDKKDDFTAVPADCLSVLGTLEYVMNLELTSSRKLAREDVNKVLSSLQAKGFFIQMPPVLLTGTDTLQ